MDVPLQNYDVHWFVLIMMFIDVLFRMNIFIVCLMIQNDDFHGFPQGNPQENHGISDGSLGCYPTWSTRSLVQISPPWASTALTKASTTAPMPPWWYDHRWGNDLTKAPS